MYVPDPTSNSIVSYVFSTIMAPSIARILRFGRCGSDIELLGEIQVRPLVHAPSKKMVPPVLRALPGKGTATRVRRLNTSRQGKANEPASARQRCRSVPDRRTTPRPPASFPQVLCRGLHPKAFLANFGRIQRACGALMGARRGGGGRERLVGWLVRLGTNQARRRLVVTNLKDYGSCFSYRPTLTHARQRERQRERRRERRRRRRRRQR